MDTAKTAQHVIATLNKLEVNYMVVGSFSTNFYCVPRATQDVDIVIETDLTKVARKVSDSSDELSLDPQLGFESVTAITKALLTSNDGAFHVELFGLSKHPHDRKRFERRTEVELLGQPTWIATAEDVVITKLQWAIQTAREKDVSDVRNVIALQHEALDWPYIEHWCGEHETTEKLVELRTQLGV